MNKLETLLAERIDSEFETAQIPWFRELVECPSCSREPDEVAVALAMLDAKMGELGWTGTLHPDPTGNYAPHRVYETARAHRGEEALALVGHVDTVFPRDMAFLDFERDGDVARGPGVLDMKSGLSTIVFALSALREVAPESFDNLSLRFVCNTDEEVGSPTSAGLMRSIAHKTSRALVFEGGREADRIVVRRKGTATFEVLAHGRAVHAGNHHADGVNAIHALALVIPRLAAVTDYGRGVTVNVGLVEGGTAKNTVPGEAHCVIDLRYEHAPDGEAAQAAMRAAVAEVTDQGLKGARLELLGGLGRPPMEPSEASQALRVVYEACASMAGLGIGEAPLQGGGSDANHFADAGVPTIDGLGPYGERMHSEGEWCSLESLRRRTLALGLYLLRHA